MNLTRQQAQRLIDDIREDEQLRLFVCTDHAGYWPVGTASVIVARNEETARAMLDSELAARKLATSDADPYTLTEVPLNMPHALVLRDGDY